MTAGKVADRPPVWQVEFEIPELCYVEISRALMEWACKSHREQNVRIVDLGGGGFEMECAAQAHIAEVLSYHPCRAAEVQQWQPQNQVGRRCVRRHDARLGPHAALNKQRQVHRRAVHGHLPWQDRRADLAKGEGGGEVQPGGAQPAGQARQEGSRAGVVAGADRDVARQEGLVCSSCRGVAALGCSGLSRQRDPFPEGPVAPQRVRGGKAAACRPCLRGVMVACYVSWLMLRVCMCERTLELSTMRRPMTDAAVSRIMIVRNEVTSPPRSHFDQRVVKTAKQTHTI